MTEATAEKKGSQERTKTVLNLIKDHSQANGYVSTTGIAESLGFTVHAELFSNTTDLCVASRGDDKKKSIRVASSMTLQEQNCALAWILATYILNGRTLTPEKPIRFNIFTMREFRASRYSRTMLLATRLTMTEEAIKKVTELDNHIIQNKLIEHVTIEFANAAIKDQSVAFLISNEYI